MLCVAWRCDTEVEAMPSGENLIPPDDCEILNRLLWKSTLTFARSFEVDFSQRSMWLKIYNYLVSTTELLKKKTNIALHSTHNVLLILV